MWCSTSRPARPYLQRRPPLRLMDLVPRADLETCRHFAGLGLEPLGDALSGRRSRGCFGKRAPLKAALLDQRLIAGLGNIYVCRPSSGPGFIPKAPAGSLADAAGEPTGRRAASPKTSARAPRGGRGARLDAARTRRPTARSVLPARFPVYDRAGEPGVTPDCAGAVTRVVQSGRSTSSAPCAKRARTPRPPAPSFLTTLLSG